MYNHFFFHQFEPTVAYYLLFKVSITETLYTTMLLYTVDTAALVLRNTIAYIVMEFSTISYNYYEIRKFISLQ